MSILCILISERVLGPGEDVVLKKVEGRPVRLITDRAMSLGVGVGQGVIGAWEHVCEPLRTVLGARQIRGCGKTPSSAKRPSRSLSRGVRVRRAASVAPRQSGGATYLTLLVLRRRSSTLANNVAKYADP